MKQKRKQGDDMENEKTHYNSSQQSDTPYHLHYENHVEHSYPDK